MKSQHDHSAAMLRVAVRLLGLEPQVAAIRATRARSLNAAAARLNRQGITTARGGAWTAEQVKRVLAQADSAHRALGAALLRGDCRNGAKGAAGGKGHKPPERP